MMVHILKIVLALFAFYCGAFGHWDSAYFRQANDGFDFGRTKWMEKICDDTPISELALPGTHDSATFKISGDSVSTQILNFGQQLSAGIRVFDIHIKHESNTFILHRGGNYLDVSFGDFLLEVKSFLSSNPSETVLFRLKKEQDDGPGNTRSMRDTLEQHYLNPSNEFYLKTTKLDLTLGQARGKFIILNDQSDFDGLGIGYGNFDIQDASYLGSNWDLYGKWEKIADHLQKSMDGAKETWFMNYLSASGGSFPYFVASGHSSPGTGAERLVTGLTTPGWKYRYLDFPRVHCFIGICSIAFEGTNVLTRDKIQYMNMHRWGSRSYGIIMADYPGDSLIQEIINNNWRACVKK